MSLICRRTDNAAVYVKVVADDGQPESLNDKRTLCILLTKSLLSVLETFRSKILSFDDLECLEEILKFCRGITQVMYKAVTELCGLTLAEYCPMHPVFFPLIRQARQFEIHSILCYMACILTQTKKMRYFETCQKVSVLNKYVLTLQPSRYFLDDYLVKHPHFHCTLPPKPKPRRKYEQKYY